MEKSSVSILIEWENAILAGHSRAVRMLHNLSNDLQEIGPDSYSEVEIISGFDPTGINSESVENMLREGLGALSWVTIRNVPLPGRSYYEMRNECALEAR